MRFLVSLYTELFYKLSTNWSESATNWERFVSLGIFQEAGVVSLPSPLPISHCYLDTSDTGPDVIERSRRCGVISPLCFGARIRTSCQVENGRFRPARLEICGLLLLSESGRERSAQIKVHVVPEDDRCGDGG